MKKEYLGDSVYITYDGYGFIMTTENGTEPSNTIYLEPMVVMSLYRFVDQIARKSPTAPTVEEVKP